jgi:hypothetical protein
MPQGNLPKKAKCLVDVSAQHFHDIGSKLFRYLYLRNIRRAPETEDLMMLIRWVKVLVT